MKRFTAQALGVAAAALSIGLASLPATAAPARQHTAAPENFTLVVFPDTQYSAESFPQAFNAQGKWVKDNTTTLNIKYAIHEGDIVDDSDQQNQWNNATSALGRLTGTTPYILGVGNHDMDAMPLGQNPAVVRDAKAFNRNFPRRAFSSLPTFGGSYPATQNDNSYHLFSAGGTDWLLLSLKYAPTDDEIAWGNKVITDHPNRQVAVVTHAYQNGTTKDATGRKLWTDLVSRHANVSLVFSGHYVNQGLITEKGINGNTVYQIQADYQNPSALEPNSYLRILRFNPVAKTISVRTYSPYLNKNMTDAKNQFTLQNVNFPPAKR
ncbi:MULTISPECIES: metallophosphoesterase [unclassified Streptomyces]|uniref:metallophosphoesterase n=1 Tax=unclassified Streptomyces TaxID=2593676 RepID=UPI001446741C|nr:metallophosphoesterase [Streptomyces sp. A1136]